MSKGISGTPHDSSKDSIRSESKKRASRNYTGKVKGVQARKQMERTHGAQQKDQSVRTLKLIKTKNRRTGNI